MSNAPFSVHWRIEDNKPGVSLDLPQLGETLGHVSQQLLAPWNDLGDPLTGRLHLASCFCALREVGDREEPSHWSRRTGVFHL